MHSPYLSAQTRVRLEAAFDEEHVLEQLKHYLPSQAPLKDFIHHNTLHAFQHLPFHDGGRQAAAMLGYKTYLSLSEYRKLFAEKAIREEILNRVIVEHHGKDNLSIWRDRLLRVSYFQLLTPRIGRLRALWKEAYQLDLDSQVHPKLFRLLNSFLDQGVSIWRFPLWNLSFLESLRELERQSMVSLFESKRARELLLQADCSLEALLKIVVGREELFENYLFDQQFAHPGWSGMMSVLEKLPVGLLDQRKVSLKEFIIFELLLEIDALDTEFGEIWMPLGGKAKETVPNLFEPEPENELFEVKRLWQEAFEWSYFDEVLGGVSGASVDNGTANPPPFQAIFCIDDRECSLRRHVERRAEGAQTFGTPGHFGIDAYYRPEHGKFVTKICPAPLSPKHLIKATQEKSAHHKELSYAKTSHGLLSGFFFAQTIGFLAALKLMVNIFRPSVGAATTLSFKHMSEESKLAVEATGAPAEEGLQIGYTLEEMADRVEAVLKSIGLVKDFAPMVYLVAHGSSSVNNTHYAGYDCGACSGRPGSVNSRSFALMANHPRVRELLAKKGLNIPEDTQFIGSLHDTSRDEIRFYDERVLSKENQTRHQATAKVFEQALSDNAHERSRRFELAPKTRHSPKLHEHVKARTVSLFEPRPELNHATNAMCIVGTRQLSKQVFLDRRAFLNSYDPKVDVDGKYLTGILNAVAPVCGGINLEYYFSRVDNEKLGAGTKLPHNVMGLFGVSNGMEGDLRTGLPWQMVEVHDPVRLLVIVEQKSDFVLECIRRNAATYEWFAKEWVRLATVHPETRSIQVFRTERFVDYLPSQAHFETIDDLHALFEKHHDNIPVMLVK